MATDRAIYYREQYEDDTGAQMKFNRWQSTYGVFTTAPTSVVKADGLATLFARGVDRSIWISHETEKGGVKSLTPWQSLGGKTRRFAC